MLKFNKITVRALGFLNVTKTMKYQMAIRHRNKYSNSVKVPNIKLISKTLKIEKKGNVKGNFANWLNKKIKLAKSS